MAQRPMKNRLYKARMAKFRISKEEEIHYKNLPLLQKFLTDRGKILSRRVTGITTKQQRKLSSAIKHARYLGLMVLGGHRK